VRDGFVVSSKEKLIVSIGRFDPLKRQDVLIEAFRAACNRGLRGWRLVVAGGLERTPENTQYTESLRSRSDGYPIVIAVDLDGSLLKRLLESASIFWHAKGVGLDESLCPEMMEHFGISTVEAMSAGCVPIVFGGGGQREIVRHREDGILWYDQDELVAETISLTKNAERLARMREAARISSVRFSKEVFARRLMETIEPLLA
jgi:glycosyltransferase involved in cell wall biosynthesis